jgi:hypothetical protein
MKYKFNCIINFVVPVEKSYEERDGVTETRSLLDSKKDGYIYSDKWG